MEQSVNKNMLFSIRIFHHIPKIHKSTTNPPGRPIVAAMDSITSPISQYIDQFLQPLAQKLPSYIRDGVHLLEQLAHYTWEPTYMWASLHVNLLYTSIPHPIGLRATASFLSTDPLLNPRQAEFILEVTEFCLMHNYFKFDGEFYLQVMGTAMGANFAPSYANLTMGLWEANYIWFNNPYISHIIFYGGYIDDIIVIWDGQESLFLEFLQHCNNNTYSLSFTSEHHPQLQSFLDLTLYHHEGKILSKNYTKPTAGNSFLHHKSCHHPRWINNIPKSQLHRNCTRETDYIEQGSHLKQKFIEKAFPPLLVVEAFNFYLSDHSVQSKDPNQPLGQPVRFVTQFHTKHKEMVHILSKHWSILLEDPQLKPTIPSKPKF